MFTSYSYTNNIQHETRKYTLINFNENMIKNFININVCLYKDTNNGKQ